MLTVDLFRRCAFSDPASSTANVTSAAAAAAKARWHCQWQRIPLPVAASYCGVEGFQIFLQHVQTSSFTHRCSCLLIATSSSRGASCGRIMCDLGQESMDGWLGIEEAPHLRSTGMRIAWLGDNRTVLVPVIASAHHALVDYSEYSSLATNASCFKERRRGQDSAGYLADTSHQLQAHMVIIIAWLLSSHGGQTSRTLLLPVQEHGYAICVLCKADS